MPVQPKCSAQIFGFDFCIRLVCLDLCDKNLLQTDLKTMQIHSLTVGSTYRKAEIQPFTREAVHSFMFLAPTCHEKERKSNSIYIFLTAMANTRVQIQTSRFQTLPLLFIVTKQNSLFVSTTKS